MAVGFSLSRDKTTASAETRLDKTVTVDEAELQKQTQVEEQLSKEIGVTSTLDEQTQQLVKDLIDQLSSGVLDAEDSGLAELTKTIVDRSKTAEADVTGQISAITDDARLQGEQELQQLQTQLAQQSGGSLANTLVTSSTGVARANLESQIARTKGELNLQARQVVSDELAGALTGISQAEAQVDPVDNITNLLNVLKGSTVEQEQVGETVSTSESELSRLLDSITETKALETTASRTAATSAKIGFGN